MSVMLSLRNLAGPVSYLPRIGFKIRKMRENVRGTERARDREMEIQRHKG